MGTPPDSILNEDILDNPSYEITHTVDDTTNEIRSEITIKKYRQLTTITSSYGAELCAIQIGLHNTIDLNPFNQSIHLYTDSLSCMQQLATLPYKPRYVNDTVADCADQLAILIIQ